MLNTQLKSLNREILKNLKDNQHYIALSPMKIKSKSVKYLQIGDIIQFNELSFVVRTKSDKLAETVLVKSDFEEGFLVKEFINERIEPLEDSRFSILDIRVVAISMSDIKLDSWIGFGWRITSSVVVFIDDSLMATGRLVELENGFGVEILKIGNYL